MKIIETSPTTADAVELMQLCGWKPDWSMKMQFLFTKRKAIREFLIMGIMQAERRRSVLKKQYNFDILEVETR